MGTQSCLCILMVVAAFAVALAVAGMPVIPMLNVQ